jgi:RNA polymerase-binding transcription factor
MPAKKPAKKPKQSSKPAASKTALVKKKAVVVSKSKASPKRAAKPVKVAPKHAAKPAAKSHAKVKATAKPGKPVSASKAAPAKSNARVAAKAAAPKAAAKPATAKAPLPGKPVSKPETRKVASAPPPPAAKATSKPTTAPKAAEPLTPPTPIRSAVAVKSSVPAVKSKKDSAASAANLDAEEIDLESLSLLSGPRNVKPYQVKRDEEYMNAAQLEHFRTILQSWKKDLMTEVDRTVLHMKDEAANFPDPNDRATQESEFSLELRTRDRERKLIRKIEEALNRIEDGSYGYCTETGEEIGVKRLEARPVATLCVEAQERRERRERQYGDRDDRYR